jgi:hypothetical protein
MEPYEGRDSTVRRLSTPKKDTPFESSAARPNDRFMEFSIIEKATPEITLITLRVI